MPRGIPNNPRDPNGRKKRTPLGTPQAKLAVEARPGYQRRWVNDTPGRLQRAAQGDYEHVKGADDSFRSEVVGVNDDGSPLSAYLMEIPMEFYKEDQAVKQREIAKVDDAIQRGNIRGADPKDGKQYYVPDEGISVRTD